MRVVTEQSLAFRDTLLQFSKAEMATMRAASEIARKARERMREELGVAVAEEHAFDVVLGEIEHNWKEFEDGQIGLTQVESFRL